MKYFKFKRLNKRRKIDFIVFLLGGCFFIFSAIINCNIWQGLFGFVMLVECLDIYNDQTSEDLIENYRQMLFSLHKIFLKTLKNISDMIKENDTDNIQDLINLIDTSYDKEKEDLEKYDTNK